MRCVACGAVNERGRAYCGYCAHSLGGICPVCQYFNGEGIRYCGGCARDLLVAVAQTVTASAAVPVPALAPTPVVVRPLPARAPVAAFDDLEDLRGRPAPAVGSETPQPAAADTTQEAIDGFFQRLVQEGVAVISPPGAVVPPPGPPRSASS